MNKGLEKRLLSPRLTQRLMSGKCCGYCAISWMPWRVPCPECGELKSRGSERCHECGRRAAAARLTPGAFLCRHCSAEVQPDRSRGDLRRSFCSRRCRIRDKRGRNRPILRLAQLALTRKGRPDLAAEAAWLRKEYRTIDTALVEAPGLVLRIAEGLGEP